MTWRDDLNYGLTAFGLRIPERVPLDEWAERFAADPASRTAAVVGLGSLLFYAAERGHNPKVRSIYDAMVYTSTCLSVGYGDIFAHTPLGKVLGSTLMTIGPALSSRALDGPTNESSERVQGEILAALRGILDRLPLREAGG
jgi:voltage-gated potassium channel